MLKGLSHWMEANWVTPAYSGWVLFGITLCFLGGGDKYHGGLAIRDQWCVHCPAVGIVNFAATSIAWIIHYSPSPSPGVSGGCIIDGGYPGKYNRSV